SWWRAPARMRGEAAGCNTLQSGLLYLAPDDGGRTMSLRSLRWLTFVAPACFLVLLEVIRAFAIEPRFPGLASHLIGAPIVLAGILIFSIWVFRRLEAQQQRILNQN